MKRILSRRAFLQGSAAAAGGVLASKTILLERSTLAASRWPLAIGSASA